VNVKALNLRLAKMDDSSLIRRLAMIYEQAKACQFTEPQLIALEAIERADIQIRAGRYNGVVESLCEALDSLTNGPACEDRNFRRRATEAQRAATLWRDGMKKGNEDVCGFQDVGFHAWKVRGFLDYFVHECIMPIVIDHRETRESRQRGGDPNSVGKLNRRTVASLIDKALESPTYISGPPNRHRLAISIRALWSKRPDLGKTISTTAIIRHLDALQQLK